MNEGYQVRAYRAGDAPAFRSLNEDWISEYFDLEPIDQKVLADPHGSIIAPGGAIFIAEAADEVIGCVALARLGPEDFEIGKMAVAKKAMGRGAGRALLIAAIDEARRQKAARIFLETNDALTPALRLYESAGFKRISADDYPPSPYARANVRMRLDLTIP
ncbi:MAG: GNAT family N-acetyltransferase [Pseudomonadota bacterium]